MRSFFCFLFLVIVLLPIYSMEQSPKLTPTKSPFKATIESLRIVTDLGKNRPIANSLADLMHIDQDSLKKATVDQLLARDDVHTIKTAYSNNDGLMELLQKEAPNKEQQINAKMDYELAQKGRYVRWRFLKGSIQLLSALGIGAVLFNDIKNFGRSLIAWEIQSIDAVKMGLCFAGMGFASFSLGSSGLGRINKAFSHETYCKNQKNIARENSQIVDKLYEFNTKRSNPETPYLGEVHSSSSEFDSNSSYPPSNKN